MTAENVQAAIDELKGDIPTSIAAEDITYDNTESGLTADDVQAAIDEIYSNLVSNQYLSTETKIGKWGADDLYRKVINVQALPNNTTETVNTGLSGVRIRHIDMIAYGTSGSDHESFTLGDGTITACSYYYNDNQISITSNTDLSAYEADIVLEYTKNA